MCMASSIGNNANLPHHTYKRVNSSGTNLGLENSYTLRCALLGGPHRASLVASTKNTLSTIEPFLSNTVIRYKSEIYL